MLKNNYLNNLQLILGSCMKTKGFLGSMYSLYIIVYGIYLSWTHGIEIRIGIFRYYLVLLQSLHSFQNEDFIIRRFQLIGIARQFSIYRSVIAYQMLQFFHNCSTFYSLTSLPMFSFRRVLNFTIYGRSFTHF